MPYLIAVVEKFDYKIREFDGVSLNSEKKVKKILEQMFPEKQVFSPREGSDFSLDLARVYLADSSDDLTTIFEGPVTWGLLAAPARRQLLKISSWRPR